MARFEARNARGGWWVWDGPMQQWTACADETEATELASELNSAASQGYDAIARERLQWVRGSPYDPGVEHATLLPPPGSADSAPSDTDAVRDRR